MVRLSKLTDYALVVMSCMARGSNRSSRNARDLSLELQVPLPTVSKLLKVLLRSGLLISQRGIKGGYSLSRKPDEISLAEIIAALEARSRSPNAVLTRSDCAPWSSAAPSRRISRSLARQ